MNGPMVAAERDDDETAPTTGDDDYARGYSEGFGEGLREALREVLQHASRGHTAQELRILIESRLARVDEEVELKRRSLVRPPRRPAWAALLRPPSPPAAWSATRAPLPPAPVLPGGSVLIREEVPERALKIVEVSHSAFARILAITTRPPKLSEAAAAKLVLLRTGARSADPDDRGLAPSEISGRIREMTGPGAPALIYVDALDFLATEYTFVTTLRFLYWVGGQVAETGSALVASVDPKSLDPRDLSRLQRAFSLVP